MSPWHGRPTRLVLLIFLTLLGMVLNELGYLDTLEQWALRLLAPPQRALASVEHDVGTVLDTFHELGTLRRENEALRNLANTLMIENVRLKEAETENEDLRRLLQFTRANPNQEYRAAEVIGRVIGWEPTNFLSYLSIDVGSEQGIQMGMPVATDEGLVGCIAEAGFVSSKVLLIIDPRSSVNALMQSSRASGVVEGVVGGGLIMKYIAQDQIVSVGDVVLTSGLGGHFPKGLVIGQVTALHKQDIEMFQQTQVRPTVDFSRLERVLVITGFQLSEGPQEGR